MKYTGASEIFLCSKCKREIILDYDNNDNVVNASKCLCSYRPNKDLDKAFKKIDKLIKSGEITLLTKR
jgi:hypothetical protein